MATKAELERMLNEELKRVCAEAARSAIRPGMTADEMKRAAKEAAHVAADAVISRFIDKYDLDSVSSKINVRLSEVGVSFVVG